MSSSEYDFLFNISFKSYFGPSSHRTGMSLIEDFLLTTSHEISGYRVKLSYRKIKSLIHLVSVIEQGAPSSPSS